MKKTFLSTFLIITLLFGSYRDAKAFVLNPAALAAAAGSIILISGGAYYYLKNNGQASFDGSKFSRDAGAAYILMDTLTRIPQYILKDIDAMLDGSTVLDAAYNNPAAYPKLYAAAKQSQFPQLNEGTKEGDIVFVNGSYNKVTGIAHINDGNGCWQANGGGNQQILSTDPLKVRMGYGNHPDWPGSFTTVRDYTLAPSAAPPPAKKTLPQFADSVAPLGSVGADYKDELDKMMANPAYTPKFNDQTGLPWAPPADVITPEQADAAEKAAAAAAAAQQAVQSAQSSADAAHSAASSAAAAAQANPADASLAAAASAAAAKAKDADVVLDKAKADLAALDAAQAKDAADEKMPDPEQPPQRKSINWDKWKALKGAMSNVWPFTLLLSLAGLFSQLVATPSAPVFDLPLMGNTLHIDLSFFDPIAMICRWVLGLLLTIGAVQLVVKWYRGVS